MDRLAELREKRGLTLRELSRMSGVSPDTINQIELGHRRPRPSTLRKLARALDIDIEDFFEDEELTSHPKVTAPPSLEEWLEERCGHFYLAGDRDEIADFLRDAESLEDHKARRRLLTDEVLALDEERKKTSSFIEAEIGGVSYLEIRMRYLTATLVSVEVGALTAQEATREFATA
jgi:transcriptional regulator with XRE-family HTH domain